MTDEPEISAAPGAITHLLGSVRQGDREALDRLFQVVYAELRGMARRQLARARPGDTLQTTALVHEAYVKLVGAASRDWQDRHHFFAVASRAMRQIVVDAARAQAAQKRGGATPRLALEDQQIAAASRPEELGLLDRALTELESHSDRPARVVELRFFGGLSVEETAAVMNLSERTVKREWRKARAFLFDALRREGLG